MANPQHLALVRKGAFAIAEWRRSNPTERLDLGSANLGHADLRQADLRQADLAHANLARADLAYADLYEAYLFDANLSRANLRQTWLANADLASADLSGANLNGAHLHGVRFYRSVVVGADFSNAKLGNSLFADVDLSRARGLATVEQWAPSSVGIDTLLVSLLGAGNELTPELRTFFRGAGVPGELLNEITRIAAEVKYDRCFIA